MSKSIQALRERHDALAREVKNLVADNTGGSWNSEHQATYDAKMGEIETVRAEIRRLEQVAALDVENAARAMGVREGGEGGGNATVFSRFLRDGREALSAQEWQAFRNTMSTGTGSEGGYTVET